MKLAWDMFTLLSCAQYCTNQGVDNTILPCQIVTIISKTRSCNNKYASEVYSAYFCSPSC